MITGKNLNGSMRCIKYLLVLFNLLFIITGIVMVVVGSTIHSVYNEFSQFFEERFFSPATLLVSTGFIVFGVSSVGFLGAIRESTCLIMAFAFSLQIIFILEVSVALSGYLLINDVRNVLHNTLANMMLDYNSDNGAKAAMDSLQEKAHCCGVDGPNDWKSYFGSGNSVTPPSCCAPYSNDPCAGIYKRGCASQLEFIFRESGFLLGGTALSLGSLQLIGVIFAFSLGRMLRLQKVRREHQRWLMRQELLKTYDQYFVLDQNYPVISANNFQKKEAIEAKSTSEKEGVKLVSRKS